MPDEPNTATLEAPVLTSEPEVAEPQVAQPTEGAPPEGEEGAAPPKKTWDEFHAEAIEADEDYKTAFEGAKSAEYFRGREEAFGSVPEVQQYNANLKQLEGQYRKAIQEFPVVAAAIQQAIDTDNWENLEPVFRKNPNAWQAIDGMSKATAAQGVTGYLEAQNLEPLGIDPSHPETLGQQMLGRLYLQAHTLVELVAKKASNANILKEFDTATQSGTPGNVALEKVLDDFATHHRNLGARLGKAADSEIKKADARSGGGPDTTPKGAGGGNLTAEGYKQKLARGEAVTPEEVDAMTRRYLT